MLQMLLSVGAWFRVTHQENYIESTSYIECITKRCMYGAMRFNKENLLGTTGLLWSEFPIWVMKFTVAGTQLLPGSIIFLCMMNTCVLSSLCLWSACAYTTLIPFLLPGPARWLCTPSCKTNVNNTHLRVFICLGSRIAVYIQETGVE